jgi:MoxR-like ATPase
MAAVVAGTAAVVVVVSGAVACTRATLARKSRGPRDPSVGEQRIVAASDIELLGRAAQARTAILQAMSGRIVGQTDVVELMMISLLARGHALLVGVPGVAKTLLVSSLADALSLSFGRVQFTPDLLPADITGTDVIQEQLEGGVVRRSLKFMPGPIFHNLVLADEINRTPPKTQSALLQAMQERRVTVGTSTHALPDPFLVFATRNPIDQEGTYVLPEAQLDRFLLEIQVDYPSEVEEREVARRTTSANVGSVTRVLSAEALRELQDLIPRMPVTAQAVELAVALGRGTRPKLDGAASEIKQYVRFGAGPRGSQALVLAGKARAALRGQAACDVEDIRALLMPVLRHRVVLSFRAEADGVTEEDVLRGVLSRVQAK